MNKKILILVNHDLVIYNFRKELVQELINQGYEVYISSPDGERIPALIGMGCQFIETPINRHGKNPFHELKLFKTYCKLIKKIQPICVLTYTIKPNIFGAWASRILGIPCIANITGLGTAVEKKSILQLITIFLYKIAFRKIHTVFFQNQENMSFFVENNIALASHELLPGSGVNLNEFKYMDYPKETTIEFVFISRIMKEKGIELFIEAAKIIKNEYPNTRFHICGFCEENYEKLLDMYQKQEIIIYHGMVKDVRKILAKTHCTVHPTYYPEGLSNVLLESSACGRPLIATNRSGCKEVIEEGKNGYLIAEKSIDELVEAIQLFLKQPYEIKKSMGVYGREIVEQRFNREIVINEYMKKIKLIEG